MIEEFKALAIVAAVPLLVIGITITLALGWRWYTAGVQQAVYERQGIHMTRWEVFIGAKPAVRVAPAVAE